MPLPAIVAIIAAALTLYEALEVLNDIYEGLDKYNKGVDEAKKQLEKMIQELKDEIDRKIEREGTGPHSSGCRRRRPAEPGHETRRRLGVGQGRY